MVGELRQAFGIVLLSWLFFAPIAAWHHIVVCGVLAPVVLNGESPQAGHLLWGQYQLRFFVGRLAVSVVLWSCAVFFLSWLLRGRHNFRG
jgi:hypothetical protein